MGGLRTILFVDEIHRFSQQDALLHAVKIALWCLWAPGRRTRFRSELASILALAHRGKLHSLADDGLPSWWSCRGRRSGLAGCYALGRARPLLPSSPGGDGRRHNVELVVVWCWGLACEAPVSSPRPWCGPRPTARCPTTRTRTCTTTSSPRSSRACGAAIRCRQVSGSPGRSTGERIRVHRPAQAYIAASRISGTPTPGPACGRGRLPGCRGHRLPECCINPWPRPPFGAGAEVQQRRGRDRCGAAQRCATARCARSTTCAIVIAPARKTTASMGTTARPAVDQRHLPEGLQARLFLPNPAAAAGGLPHRRRRPRPPGAERGRRVAPAALVAPPRRAAEGRGRSAGAAAMPPYRCQLPLH